MRVECAPWKGSLLPELREWGHIVKLYHYRILPALADPDLREWRGLIGFHAATLVHAPVVRYSRCYGQQAHSLASMILVSVGSGLTPLARSINDGIGSSFGAYRMLMIAFSASSSRPIVSRR